MVISEESVNLIKSTQSKKVMEVIAPMGNR